MYLPSRAATNADETSDTKNKTSMDAKTSIVAKGWQSTQNQTTRVIIGKIEFNERE